MAAVASIYDEAVRHGTATFDIDPPGEMSMRQHFHELTQNGFPYVTFGANFRKSWQLAIAHLRGDLDFRDEALKSAAEDNGKLGT